MKKLLYICLFLIHCLLTTGCYAGYRETGDSTQQEERCTKNGWQRITLQVNGLEREVLWKAPKGAWTKGAIIVMHGGGGKYTQFCVTDPTIVAPQVNFTTLAINDGFAVFTINSSDQVTDNEGRMCGKIWDDEVRNRQNIDLPFIEQTIKNVIPSLRPTSSKQSIFMTGLSSGGYMTVRAATHFNNLITAFAPVSSGDPYGWHRICKKGMTIRKVVNGVGLDNETGKQIIEQQSCLSDSYPNEKTWDTTNPDIKPAYRIFHHEADGINDSSCAEKVGKLLRLHGYQEEKEFIIKSNGRRRLVNHLWQDEYNRPILDFFSSQNKQTKQQIGSEPDPLPQFRAH